MEHALLYSSCAIVFGFIMAWGIGANDVANAMGTSVGSRAITIGQAVIIASIFEAAGALLAGDSVTSTIRSSIIDAGQFTYAPEVLVQGMLASLLAAGSWLLLATYFGWPVSTTHSIVGAIVGFALIVLGVQAVYWQQVINIVLSWVVTPILAGLLSYGLFRSVQFFIFNVADPVDAAKRFVPVYVFLSAFVVSLVTVLKGLDHVGLNFSHVQAVIASILFSLFVAGLGKWWLHQVKLPERRKGRYLDLAILEKLFGVLMAITACAMAFAHGSNDVANAIGPLSGIIGIISHGGAVEAHVAVPLWIMLLGAVGIVLGFAIYGHKVMATVGSEITQLTPSRGFAAQLATAATVVLASALGLPVSTTQTLVGAVLGIGFARGMGALNLTVVRNIFLSWIITLPAGALFAIIYFYLLHGLTAWV